MVLVGEVISTSIQIKWQRGKMVVGEIENHKKESVQCLLGNSVSFHTRTGGVLIVAQRKLSTLRQYLTWFNKSSTSTGKVHFIRDRKKDTINTWRRRITQLYSTHCSLWCSCSCCNGNKAAAIAALFLSILTFTHTLHTLTFALK